MRHRTKTYVCYFRLIFLSKTWLSGHGCLDLSVFYNSDNHFNLITNAANGGRSKATEYCIPIQGIGSAVI
jgi:hypothetical protein